MAKTFEVPTSNGYQTVTADNKQAAVAQVPNAQLRGQTMSPSVVTTPTTVAGPDIMSTVPLVTPATIPQNPEVASTSAYVKTGVIDPMRKEQEDIRNEALKEKERGQSDIVNLMQQLGQETAIRNQEQEEAGLDVLKQARNTYLSQLEAEQAALQDQIEQYNNQKGTFGGANEANIAEAQRQSAIKQTRIGLNLALTNRNYEMAYDIAERNVQAQLAPLKNQLEIKQFLYAENKDTFTKADDRLWQQSIKEDERAYQEAYDQKKSIQDMIIDAAQGGAPQSVLTQAQNATTPEEAARITGPYSSKALDRQIQRAQLANIYSQISERNSQSNPNAFVTPPLINPTTGKTDPAAQLASAIDGSNLKNNENVQNIAGVIAATQQLAQSNEDGNFPGIHFGSTFIKNAQGQQNAAAIEAINLRVQTWASGAALTEAQTKQVERLTPRLGDTDAQIRNKTNGLANFMMSQAQGQFISQGYNFVPQRIDYFDPKQSYTEKDREDMDKIPG